MSYKITAPQRLNSNSIPNLLLSFSDLIYIEDEYDIIFDLSKTEWVDTEGLNYIALLPFRLKAIFDKIIIIPPKSSDLITYFEYTGLLKIFFDNFIVAGFNCIEDIMFNNKRIKGKNNVNKSKISLISKDSFNSFLRYELLSLEKLIYNEEYSSYFCRCFYELTKNIFDHSTENVGGFAFHLKNDKNRNCSVLSLSISDVGIGIKKSLISKLEDIPANEFESYYIEQALKEGVTSTNIEGRGLGLFEVINFSSKVQIVSGNGLVKIEEGIIKARENLKTFTDGTNIQIEISFN